MKLFRFLDLDDEGLDLVFGRIRAREIPDREPAEQILVCAGCARHFQQAVAGQALCSRCQDRERGEAADMAPVVEMALREKRRLT